MPRARKSGKSLAPAQPPANTGKWNDTRKAAQLGAKENGKKVSKKVLEEGTHSNAPFSWTAQRVDEGHRGSWDWDLSAAESKKILQFLEDMSRLTWGEIDQHRTGGNSRHKKHHSQEVKSLCREAQRRFPECFSKDEEIPDQVYRFRFGGTERLWGIRVQGRFEMIWFDRNHKVYPTEPD